MLKKVHHIAYIVKDLNQAIDLYENVFQVKISERLFFEPRGIDVALFYVGDILFELIQPIKDGTRAFKYLEEHGEGFFHIAFEVDEIQERLDEVKTKGMELIHHEPIAGVDWDVAWIERQSTLGVYTQFIKPKN